MRFALSALLESLLILNLRQVRTRTCSVSAGMSEASSSQSISFLDQENSIQLDVDLMQQPGFSLDQLMELAGLSVASAITKEYSVSDHKNVLIVAGPGNNGGDGLVAARCVSE